MSSSVRPVDGSRHLLKSVENGLIAVNERPRLWLALLALFLIAQVRPWWYPQADGMSFLSMARSLAVEGHMRNMGSAHLWYFPGYSLLMSPLYLISEKPLWLLSAFQWTSAILFMIGAYYWARTIVPKWAVWIAAIAVVNQGVWIHCARTMSEVPFMCVLIWSANAARWAQQSRAWGQAVPRGILAAALLVLTSLIRPAGILLAVGVGLQLGWKAFQKETTWARAIVLTLLIGIPGSIAITGFLTMDRVAAAHEHGRTYLSNFSDSAANPVASYLEGLRLAIRDSGRVIIPGMFKAYQEKGWLDLNLLVYLPACLVLSVGWRRLVGLTGDALLLMTPFYVLLYVLYPYEAGARFYIPLLPVFAVSLIPLLPAAPAPRRLIVAGVFAAHFALAAGYWLGPDSARGRAAMLRWSEIEPIAKSITRHQDQVTAWDVSGDDVFMLELLLDRRVPVTRPESVPPSAEWILAKRDAVTIPQFESCVETESLRLLRRRLEPGEEPSNRAHARRGYLAQ
jgi:hypothetical protein